MKRSILSMLTLAAACLLTGCFQNETTIRLNKDGSGTITEETSFGPQAVEMLSQFAQMSAGKDDPIANLSSETKAKARAATMGEGVTVEKAEAITKDGWKGGRVTYHFADINKLKYSAEGAVKNAIPSMPGSMPHSVKESKPVLFKYDGSRLTMTIPEPEKRDDVPAPDAQKEIGPEQEEMMKQMMTGMRMSVKLVIEPGIAETNATYVDGNSIILSDIEFSKILEQPGGIKKLSQAGRNDPAQALEVMKSFEGVKVEAKKELTVTVK